MSNAWRGLLLAALLIPLIDGRAVAHQPKQTPHHFAYTLGPTNPRLPPCGFVRTKLPHWNGTFTDLDGKPACYTMIGADPANGGISTTIPVYIIPIRMKFGPDNGNMIFDPVEHTVSNGLTVIQNLIASPIFDSSHDFIAGKTELGKTQYVDAFQRGNFWSLVKVNPSYHVLLGDPQILSEQEIDVSPLEGDVETIDGISFGVISKTTFSFRLLYFLAKSFQIDSGALTIFVTYNTYLRDGDHYVGGFHGALPTCLIYCRTYAYATYVDTNGANKVFAQDVSALSHEIGEWMDDPFGNNIVSCSDPSINRHLEVGDPLEGEDRGKDGWGDYPYPLNGFTYNLQSLAFLPYFGAPPSTSVNSWTSFQGPKDNLGVCSPYTVFDILGSIQIVSSSINARGTVVGSWTPDGAFYHAFIRAADGTITTFDPPGSDSTSAESINAAGTIAGSWWDGTVHGFVRTPDGTFTTFDGVPGASYTAVLSINATGSIVGIYDDTAGQHGFVRAADGTTTTFDLPGSRNLYPYSINALSTIAGYYVDSKTAHSFMRFVDGTIMLFDVPGSSATLAQSINDKGAITGRYVSHGTSHGFVRASDGTITTFDPPGSTFTAAYSINVNGLVTGQYSDDCCTSHGFVRAYNGTITTFDPPGSSFTDANSINAAGVITGEYQDEVGFHGFLRTP